MNAIIKEICFNQDNGRLVLSDSSNNHYLCDIYGKRKLAFLPNVTGTITGAQRNKRKELQLNLCTSNSQRDVHYFPSIRKFEGYSKFPRPLVPPFSNRPPHEYSSESKLKLIKALKKHFSSKAQKLFLNLSNNNKGLSYLTCDLNKCDTASVDTKQLIKLIDETVEVIKDEYKYKANLFHKNPTVKTLTRFRLVLSENSNMKVINGRSLPEPPDEIKLLSTFIDKAIEMKSTGKSLPSNVIKFTSEKASSMALSLQSPMKTIPKPTSPLALNAKEISFLSQEDEIEVRADERKLLRIKSTENIAKEAEREFKLLTGYIEPPIQTERVIRRFDAAKLKTNGELYLRSINLMKKVNPIAFQLEIAREGFDLKQLERRKKQRAINQMNVGFNFKK